MFLGGGISCGGGETGCRNCLNRLVAHMSLYLRLAPTVPAGSRVARKYNPPLLRGNVRFVPIVCVLEASDTIRRVLWTACSEYRLNPKSGTYATSILSDPLVSIPVENHIHIPDILYLDFPTVPDRDCFATGRRGPQIIQSCPIVRHVARRAAVGNPNTILTAAQLHYERTV